MITDANGMPVLQPLVDDASTATFNTAFAQIGTVVSGASSVRQIQTYKWANSTARTNQTGMTEGDQGYQLDTDQVWTYSGTAWRRGQLVNVQADTTNSTAHMVTQVGVGKVAGNNVPSITKTVTFPVAFSSVPNVQVSYMGYRATGAFNPNGLTVSAALGTGAMAPTATGFTAGLSNYGSNLSNTLDWYFTWQAIGPM